MSKYITNFKSNEIANVTKEGLKLGFISHNCKKVFDELLREAYLKQHDQKAHYNVCARHLIKLAEDAVKNESDLFPCARTLEVSDGMLSVTVRHRSHPKPCIVRWIPYTEENSKNFVFED